MNTAPSLRQTQRALLQSITAAHPPGGADPGLRSYREAYRLRIDEALRADFRAVHAILGDREMLALSSDYIAANPSRQPSIRWVGRHLADFIATHPPWSQVPGLAAMARFEWARSLAFDAADTTPLSAEALRQLPQAALPTQRLHWLPGTQVLRLPEGLVQLWQPLVDGQTVAPLAPAGEVDWVIWRRAELTHWRSLAADESAALPVFAQGGTLVELCALLAGSHDPEAVPGIAFGLLHRWCEEQLLTLAKTEE